MLVYATVFPFPANTCQTVILEVIFSFLILGFYCHLASHVDVAPFPLSFNACQSVFREMEYCFVFWLYYYFPRFVYYAVFVVLFYDSLPDVREVSHVIIFWLNNPFPGFVNHSAFAIYLGWDKDTAFVAVLSRQIYR